MFYNANITPQNQRKIACPNLKVARKCVNSTSTEFLTTILAAAVQEEALRVVEHRVDFGSGGCKLSFMIFVINATFVLKFLQRILGTISNCFA